METARAQVRRRCTHGEQRCARLLLAIHANKERCPTMRFPSVVHLAPRRNDLFDVYSRSLTLIKITAQAFSLSLSLSFFWGPFAYIASFLFTLRRSKGLPSGNGNGATIRIFAFYPVKEILALISRYTGCLKNHDASGYVLCARKEKDKKGNEIFVKSNNYWRIFKKIYSTFFSR